MVGCGNSKMTMEMAKNDCYESITNMDISAVVLEKMKVYTDQDKFENCKNL